MIVTILSTAVTALGAYNTGRFFIDRAARARKRAKQAKAIFRGVHKATTFAEKYGSEISEVKAALAEFVAERRAEKEKSKDVA